MVDARGYSCPMPVIMVQKAVKDGAPQTLEVLVDNQCSLENVTRFANYMRGMSQRTQFIVITHRRGTMEEADVLYGVTMQEQGISRILTINLNDVEKELKIK